MSATNQRAESVVQPSARSAKQIEEVPAFREAIIRCFDVASIIEKAIRANCDESLEHFIDRMIARLLESNSETSLLICCAEEKTDHFFNTLEILLSKDDKCPSGLAIWLCCRVLQPHSAKAAYQILVQHGFPFEDYKKEGLEKLNDEEFEVVSTHTDLDRAEVDVPILANVVHSLLSGVWQVTSRDQISCYFKHDDKQSASVLTSQDGLRRCLDELLTYPPGDAGLDILLPRDDRVFWLARKARGKLLISFFPDKKKRRRTTVQKAFDAAGFSQDSEFGDSGWFAPEDSSFVASVIQNALHDLGIAVTSGKLKVQSRFQHRYF
jgi:hypothetical protein